MGVWFSCLNHASTPSAAQTCGQAYCGVGGTSGARKRAADSMASRSGSALMDNFWPKDLPRLTIENICHGTSTVTVQLFGPIPSNWPALIYGTGSKAGSPPPRTARRAPGAAHRNPRAASRHAAALDPHLRARVARQPLDGGRGLRPPDRGRPHRVATRLGFLRAAA